MSGERESLNAAPSCACGHARDRHSFAREDDFACRVEGCDCNGYSPSPKKRMWQHVCPAHNWTTVWSQNSPKCGWCGKERPA